jgi:hypothetical protein
MKKLLFGLLVVAGTTARFLESTERFGLVPFSETLPCGSCINSGYIFCRRGTNGAEYVEEPELHYCCKD